MNRWDSNPRQQNSTGLFGVRLNHSATARKRCKIIVIFVPIGANKRFSKYLISRKMDLFWKTKVHQRFWYTMRKVILELAPSLTHNCKSYRLNPQRTKVFSVTLKTRIWILIFIFFFFNFDFHLDPPANSETKEVRTMKLWTVIAYYITSITKQLKFLNSHCSIVCSYCSVVCLIA